MPNLEMGKWKEWGGKIKASSLDDWIFDGSINWNKLTGEGTDLQSHRMEMLIFWERYLWNI